MKYTQNRTNAAAVIGRKGTTATINRAVAGSYDTATGTITNTSTTTATKGVILPLSRGISKEAGSNIRAGDQQLLLSAIANDGSVITRPNVDDTVKIGPNLYTIVDVSPLSPDDTDIMYDLVIRGAGMSQQSMTVGSVIVDVEQFYAATVVGQEPVKRIASFQNHVANTLGNITFTNYASRKNEVLPKAVRLVQYEINNWWISAGSLSLASNNTNDLNLTNLYASCNGVVVRCTFAGSFTRLIVAGEDAVRCDPLTGTQFGFPSDIFPEGTKIAWTMEFTQPVAGHKFCYTSGLGYSNVYGGGGSQTYTWNPANTVMALNNVGLMTWTGTTPTTTAGGIGHMGITVGVPVESDAQSLVIRGNSQSQNETSWIQQAAFSLNWPCLNLAISASKIQAGLDDARVQRMYALASQAIIQFGRNEFPAMSVAQLKTYVAQDAAMMRSKGVLRIGCDDVPPYTTSTDSWATAANQSQAAGSGAGSNDDLFNQQILSIAGIDYKTTRNNNRDGADPFKWLTNGAASYPTADGKHSSLALETLKSTECVPLIGSPSQVAKANAETLVIIAEVPGSAAQKAAAQTAVNAASSAGANVTRLQARLDAITITVFSDPMAGQYAANSDMPVANPLWTADAAYVAGALQYTGGGNGNKVTNATGGFIIAPQQGNTVQQQITFTNRTSTMAVMVLAVLWLDKDNWIGITAFGQSALTRTTVSICQAGTVTTLTDFTNAINSAPGQIYDLKINGTTLELRQNGTLLVPVTTGADNISSQLSSFLSGARKSAIGCRSGTSSTGIVSWSNRNVV